MTKGKQEQALVQKSTLLRTKSVPTENNVCSLKMKKKKAITALTSEYINSFVSLSQEPTIPKIYIINKKNKNYHMILLV